MADNEEYKLLIQFATQKKSRFFKKMKYIVQGKPFKFGLKIKNIDSKTVPEATIQDLKLGSGEGGSLFHSIDEQFELPKLNPGQEIVLWWPDPMSSVIKGPSWIQCTVIPKQSEVKIRTHQFEPNCNKISAYKYMNSWGDAISIRGDMEHQQAITNRLVLILTLLVFLEGVWGLKVIIKFIFKNLADLLLFIGELIKQISS